MQNRPARRGKTDNHVDQCEKFGDIICCDHIVTHNRDIISYDGDQNALVIKDLATGWIECAPVAMKSADEAYVAPQNFVARNEDIQCVYSDGSGEIKSAVAQLGWRHNTSTPGRPQNNGIAERAVKDCLNGARTVLFQSGLNVRWWSKAIKYYALMHNVQYKGHKGETPWELRFGTPFPAKSILFGCLVRYLPTNPKDKNTGVHKFDPSAR